MKTNRELEEKIKNIGLENILEYSPVGIHLVDRNYRTIFYNKAMEELEGLSVNKVMGKNILEVFPSLTKETSTLVRAIENERKIVNRLQRYKNIRGEEITSVNTTLPLYDGEEVIGSLEISNNVTYIREMADELLNLQKEIQLKNTRRGINRYTFEDLIGEADVFLQTKEIAKIAGRSSSSVLIYGETGTGKELFAQSIHYSSSRQDKPFIAQNCAAIPDSLLESILFGTEKGSFTGAVSSEGIFEQANGGTLLLDEINSMSSDLQAKLLRVLQESYIRRIGGTKDIPIDVRIIATTNQEPMESIERGVIRKDLYYRLNVISLRLPLLKDRKSDIKVLTNYFIHKYNDKFNRNVQKISREVLDYFNDYDWPGNVRELENAIEAAMNLSNEKTRVLRNEHFVTSLNIIKNNNFEKTFNLKEETLPEFLSRVEKELLVTSLNKFEGNVTKSAEALGISRQSLQYKLKKYDNT